MNIFSASRPKLAQRGAIALEYILIAALVAIAGLATFTLWGQAVATAVGSVSVNSSGALEEP